MAPLCLKYLTPLPLTPQPPFSPPPSSEAYTNLQPLTLSHISHMATTETPVVVAATATEAVAQPEATVVALEDKAVEAPLVTTGEYSTQHTLVECSSNDCLRPHHLPQFL